MTKGTSESSERLGKYELLKWLEGAEHERIMYMPGYTRQQEKQAYNQIREMVEENEKLKVDLHNAKELLKGLPKPKPMYIDEMLSADAPEPMFICRGCGQLLNQDALVKYDEGFCHTVTETEKGLDGEAYPVPAPCGPIDPYRPEPVADVGELVEEIESTLEILTMGDSWIDLDCETDASYRAFDCLEECRDKIKQLFQQRGQGVDIDQIFDDICDIVSAETEVEGDPGWENFYLTKRGCEQLREILEKLT